MNFKKIIFRLIPVFLMLSNKLAYGLEETPELSFKTSELLYGIAPHFKLFTKTTKLDARKLGLTTLPWQIGELTNLTELILSENQLTTLPVEIEKLPKLTVLDLSKNKLQQLSGVIVNLTNLNKLTLSENQLTKLPVGIGKLSNLTELYLYDNLFTELPAEIEKLPKLTVLNLSKNKLQQLSGVIVNLTNLNKLTLSKNQLTKLPVGIGKLSNLTELYLYDNLFTELPAEIVNLTKLNTLSLANNKLTKLSAEIIKLNNLISLNLSGNLFTEVPGEIVNLTKLNSLLLAENQLTKLPAEIGNLTKLTLLNLAANLLTELPPEIGNLSNLTNLSLYQNKFTEPPAGIVALINLTGLYLGENELKKLPAEIRNLSKLTVLKLYDSQLEQLPAEIGDLTKLTFLTLLKNQLTKLPAEIGNLINLTTLSLSNNQLTELPAEIGKLSNLTMLSVEENQLSKLPREIGNLSNLTKLYLKNNQLTGLPAEIGNLTKLTLLSLSDNPIKSLPRSIKNCKNLQALYVDKANLLKYDDGNQIGLYTLSKIFENKLLVDKKFYTIPLIINEDEVYQELDSKEYSVNRKLLAECKVPLLPEINMPAKEMINKLEHIVTILWSNNKLDCSALFAGIADQYSYQEYANLGDKQKIFDIVIPRVFAYMKTLWNVRRLQNHEKNAVKNSEWYPKISEKPYFKNAMAHLVKKMFKEQDLDTTATYFMQFVYGVTHCQTAQLQMLDSLLFNEVDITSDPFSEKIASLQEIPVPETWPNTYFTSLYERIKNDAQLVKALAHIEFKCHDFGSDMEAINYKLEDAFNDLCGANIPKILVSILFESETDNFEVIKVKEILKKVFGKAKNETFKRITLIGNVEQNVHISQKYLSLLQDKLGLSSVMASYKDPYLAANQQDPFRSSIGNFLDCYYDKMSPEYLVKLFLEQVQTKEEAQKILDFQFSLEYVNASKAQQAKMLAKLESSCKPISYQTLRSIIRSYVDSKDIDCYFDMMPDGHILDNFEEPLYAPLTPEGARQILVQLGFIYSLSNDLSTTNEIYKDICEDEFWQNLTGDKRRQGDQNAAGQPPTKQNRPN